jgi:hypothetical protein
VVDSSGTVMAEKETMPIRLDVEAVKEARIAAAFRGLSLTRWASQVILEAAQRDIEAGSKSRGQGTAKRPKGAK